MPKSKRTKVIRFPDEAQEGERQPNTPAGLHHTTPKSKHRKPAVQEEETIIHPQSVSADDDALDFCFKNLLESIADIGIAARSGLTDHPCSFVVYAHENADIGEANSQYVTEIIEWLKKIRAPIVSDRSPLLLWGTENDTNPAVHDILSSQIRLLPAYKSSDKVEKVILCVSQVLRKYCQDTFALGYMTQIRELYDTHKQNMQKFETEIREFVKAQLKANGFHHVLTEIAFLDIRRRHHNNGGDGIISITLDGGDLGIESLTGLSVYLKVHPTPKPGHLHWLFFKLLQRLYPSRHRDFDLWCECYENLRQWCIEGRKGMSLHHKAAKETQQLLDDLKNLWVSGVRDGEWKVSAQIIEKHKEEMDRSLRQSTKEMDTWIREKRYSPANLKIERLSGKELSMDQCYINLAIVQQHPQDARSSEDGGSAHKSSPFSLFARLHVKERNEGTEVPLSTIFDPHQGPDGHEKQPRRILIRGQAGVGKTTLCKKVVYDFTYAGMWADLFSRLLWIPLRRLKGRPAGYKVQNLFNDVFFFDHTDGESAARKLHEAIADSKHDQTLFVLDGLDEVSQDFQKDGDVFRLLLYLLNQPNVIITSRPYGVLPSRLDPPDLELETIGFYPEQVKSYVKKTFPDDPHKAKEIQSFLQDHWIIQGLVRIPIQLDAVCLTWDPAGNLGRVPETMTAVYQVIEQKLWKKDLERLGKIVDGIPLHNTILQEAPPSNIERFAEKEIMLLEILAFTGLHNDVINFNLAFLDTICKYFEFLESISLPSKILQNVSFLRTSDPLPENHNRYYHFLHLTFQEYFAARYFVRRWKSGQQLECLRLEDGSLEEISPTSFLQKHKYLARYNILWRFVTGLLQAQEAEIVEFFKALEEPPDLLGPAHQRLIMHCLSEVRRSNSQKRFTLVREKLEKTLSEWLHFECNFRRRADLASEMEFPANVLTSVFLNWPEEDKAIVLESLERRPRIQSSIVTTIAPLLGEDQPRHLKRAVCGILRRCYGFFTEDVFRMVVALLKDRNSAVRQAAIQALERQPSLSDEILEKVAMRLEDQDWTVRPAAIEALKRQSSLSDKILEKVAMRLEHRDWAIRRVAIEALERHSSLPDEILEKVAVRLEDRDWAIRWAAIKALQHQSSLSDEILEKMAMRLEDQDWTVRQAAIEALERQSSLMLEKVAMRLEDQDSDVRRAAIEALERQSSLSDEILEKMAMRLEDQDSDVRQAAIEALQHQSSLPDEILEKVAVRLEHRDSDVRQAAIEALERQSSLPDKILLNRLYMGLLYKNWLQRSFDVQVNGCLVGRTFCLSTPEGVKNFSFTSEDGPDRFRDIIMEVRNTFPIPKERNIDSTAT
ncbi:uncharacterized protein Z518_06614 [Rhinocladiella mackenziei CBS 650.93]|uniref:NACHT domain-containing protein n=1 Tax=Rhinocladiella mackenziei CBS 650.93 TaxID=1442369 RepID=A0A0D2IB70_9EURO|nr:uncharacterized protein Z518_06614 [Rhinocladiella mackenziei CBS 650.93]KIX03064.1 hypothetical protein Z518_06614 [Rhinocladiella mackenziei CBS 650.93]